MYEGAEKEKAGWWQCRDGVAAMLLCGMISLPQTLVMYSPGKGSWKFQESASGNMEVGMAGQATGSCQGQQGTGSR